MPTTEVVRDHPARPLAPIDESVVIPENVRRAAEKANSHYGPAPVDPAATAPIEPAAPAAPAAPAPVEPAAPAAPAPVEPAASAAPVSTAVPVPTAEDLQNDSWAGRYNSMRGRWEASQRTIGDLQEQISQIGDELVRTQALIQSTQGPRAPANSGQPAPTERALRPEDEAAYGPELIDFVQRGARDAVAPQLATLEQRNQELEKQLQNETRRRLTIDLARAVPNWREINNSSRFKAWLRLPDVYSGGVRLQLLSTATKAADAPRVIAFFKGFLAEEQATGHADPVLLPEPSPTPRTAVIPLETLAAPGRARPAGGDNTVPVEKPVFTRAQIAKFYSQQGRASYVGREVDRARDEAAIFAAQRDGRVR